jgi:excisionase family DNA binding protein
MIKKLLTIRQAAKLLGVSTDTLRRWDKAGKLKASRHPMNNYRIYSAQTIEKLKTGIFNGIEQ